LTTLLGVTLAALLLGAAASLVLALRRGEEALGLTVLFSLGAARQMARLASGGFGELAFDAESAGEVALLGMSLSGLAALYALDRTARERDRAEDLHWDSMEAVRVLSELAGRAGIDFDEKLRALLEIGSARFDLEVGLLCRVGEDAPRAIAFRAPQKSDLTAEAVLEALETPLRNTVTSSRPLALGHDDGDTRAAPTLQAYFGTAIRTGGEVQGVLAFASRSRRRPSEPITATDKDLLGLMAQWLGTELERREQRVRTRRPTSAGRGERRRDAVRKRLERRLRRLADPQLQVSVDPDLWRARAGDVSFETLSCSLVRGARGLSPDGQLSLETGTSNGGLPDAPATSRCITLCVTIRDDALDAEALTRAFAHDPDEPSQDRPDAAPSLYGLQRLLKREGGDLSLAVEPGRGATLTAYVSDALQETPTRSVASQSSR
jgi:GAF domain-containing protein